MKLVIFCLFPIIVLSSVVHLRSKDTRSINSTSVFPTTENVDEVTDLVRRKIIRSEHGRNSIQISKNTTLKIGLRNAGYDSDIDEKPVNFYGSDINAGIRCRCVSSSECLRTPVDESDGIGIITPKNAECSSDQICCPLQDLFNQNTQNTKPNESMSVPENLRMLLSECGKRRQTTNVNNRIVSPEESKNTVFGEFPSMALILTQDISKDGEVIDNVFVCGASVVSSNVLLTAAHCVQNRSHRKLKVRAGEYDVGKRTLDESLPFQERDVATMIYHPDFNPKALHNDLALLVTTKPFTMVANVFPICSFLLDSELADPDMYDPTHCIATGWGKEVFSSDAPYSTTLKKTDLSLVPNNKCLKELRATLLGENFILNPSFMCAGGQQGMDTCQGDGGGPLMCSLNRNPNQYIQVGVTSWGVGCGNKIPAAYASLKANMNWLLAMFNEHSIPPVDIESPKNSVDFVASYDQLSDEEKYKHIFDTNEESFINHSDQPISSPEDHPKSECICLPDHVCKKYTKPLDTYGAGILNPKSASSSCKDPEFSCCDVLQNYEETHSVERTGIKPVNSTSCGVRNINGVGFRSVVEDSDTLFGEFPWVVAIFEIVWKNEVEILNLKCAGSLIHKKVVLTAAHCVIGINPEKIIVRAGEWNVASIDEDQSSQERIATKLFIHPSYNAENLYNDIALVILDADFKMEENVNTICLSTESKIFEYSNCLITGWGSESVDTYSSTLKAGSVSIVPNSKCERKFKSYHSQFEFHESWICGAGEHVCKGDAGGPLVCLIHGEDQRYEQIGIVSSSYGCARPNPYVLYTNVVSNQKWIEEVFAEFEITYK